MCLVAICIPYLWTNSIVDLLLKLDVWSYISWFVNNTNFSWYIVLDLPVRHIWCNSHFSLNIVFVIASDSIRFMYRDLTDAFADSILILYNLWRNRIKQIMCLSDSGQNEIEFVDLNRFSSKKHRNGTTN